MSRNKISTAGPAAPAIVEVEILIPPLYKWDGTLDVRCLESANISKCLWNIHMAGARALMYKISTVNLRVCPINVCSVLPGMK